MSTLARQNFIRVMSPKIRQSNIELLRIVSMLFIIVYHFLLHAIKPANPQWDQLLSALIPVVHIGVICFVLISGYWGIRFSVKGFIRLFLYCSFYSVLIYLAYTGINPGSFNMVELHRNILPFQWWFVQIYLCLYLLAPIIKMPLKKASLQQKLMYVVILAIISFVLGNFIPQLKGGKNPINFVFIYYIGSLLQSVVRAGHLPEQKRKSRAIVLYAGLSVFTFLALYLCYPYKTVYNMLYRVFYEYNGIGLILSASLLFLVLISFNLRSKYINRVARSVFSVYLLHENDYLSRYLYTFLNHMQEVIQSTALYAVFVAFMVLLVFGVAVGIDKLLSPLIYNLTERFTQLRLVRWVNYKVARA